MESKEITIWSDARTTVAGQFAGNLVLNEIARNEGESFRKLKGTVFRGKASLWIARCCGEDYLNRGDRHWTKVSLRQYRIELSEAKRKGWKLKYLLLTPFRDESVIHYWIIPGEFLGSIAFQNQSESHFEYTLRIHEDDGKYYIEGKDVTRFHHVLRLSKADAENLDRCFAASKEVEERRAGKKRDAIAGDPPPVQVLASEDDEAGIQRRSFDILLRGGQSAILSLPLPTAEVDLQRIKDWIDLMSDVLTEAPIVPAATTERRARATEAIATLQEQAVASGADKLSDDQIEAEIRTARRERSK